MDTDIQQANNISNPNLIFVGQKLWIPLPCSCDNVEGGRVIHYAHVVAAGSSIAAISEQFNVAQDTIMTINGIADPRDLKAGQVLDIPLKGAFLFLYEPFRTIFTLRFLMTLIQNFSPFVFLCLLVAVL